jgi:hypothetical protein
MSDLAPLREPAFYLALAIAVGAIVIAAIIMLAVQS